MTVTLTEFIFNTWQSLRHLDYRGDMVVEITEESGPPRGKLCGIQKTITQSSDITP
jgi:hypothetical protein